MTKVGRAAGTALGMLVAGFATQTIVSACTIYTNFGIQSVSGAPSGPAGSQFAVWGQAFAPATVDVYWGSMSGTHLATVTTSASGDFRNAWVTVPAGATPGGYFIVATDHTGPVPSVTSNTAFTVTAAPPPPTATPGPTAVPTPNPTPVPTGSAPPGQPVGSSVPAPGQGLVGATVNHATTHHGVVAAAAAATAQPAASSPAIRSRAGSPSAAPSLGKPVRGATGSLSGLPTPVVLGLVFAGLSVLGAAAFTAFLIPRRRSARAAQSVDTSFDGSEGG